MVSSLQEGYLATGSYVADARSVSSQSAKSMAFVGAAADYVVDALAVVSQGRRSKVSAGSSTAFASVGMTANIDRMYQLQS